MQGNRRKGLLGQVQNASTMLILMVFVALCVVITVIIGVHAAHKKVEASSSSEEVKEEQTAERTETQTAVKEITVGEEGSENTSVNHSTEDTFGEDYSTEEDSSSEVRDVIFEDCGEEGVLVSMIHSGGWGDEDDPFIQYDIVVNNTTEQDISGWTIRIQVSDNAECNNIWNGLAEIEDGVLTITPADFNNTLTAGTQTSVGIIIEKPGNAQFLDVTFKQGE